MSCHAASLFCASLAIEYDTVNARFPLALFLIIFWVANLTSGYVDCMYGNSQFPSKMIAAFCFPSAAPHQSTPSFAGMSARPCLMRPTEKSTACVEAVELIGEFVLDALRKLPLFSYTNASARSQLALRQIGFASEAMTGLSFRAAAAR